MNYKLSFFVTVITLPFFSKAQSDTSKLSITDTIQINEFVVSAGVPLVVKGDTMIYRVDSFNKDPLATTEDVLKKLYGIEILQNGNIVINGKPVNKIFINGKAYMGDDIRTITQNLPAEIIDKIEVADWQNEQSQFTGIKQYNDKKVINLKLKRKYNNSIYNKLTLSYGTKNRYKGTPFISYVNDNTNLTLVADANNTGLKSSNVVNGNLTIAPGLMENQKVALHLSHKFGNKIIVNGTYEYGKNKSNITEESYRITYIQQDSTMQQRKIGKHNTVPTQHNINLHGNFTINKKTVLNTTLSARYGEQNNIEKLNNLTYSKEGDVAFSRLYSINNQNKSNGFSFANLFMKRFSKERRTMVFNYNSSYIMDNSSATSNSTNQYFYPTSTSFTANLFTSKGSILNNILVVNYNEPIGEKGTLSLKYSYYNSQNEGRRNMFITDNGIYYKDTIQSQKYKNINTRNNVGLSYRFNNSKVALHVGLSLEKYLVKNSETISMNPVRQSGVNYLSDLSIQYNISQKTQLYLRYNGNVGPPSIRQLQTIPNYIDSFNIYIGNASLRPEVNNNISIRFSNYNINKDNHLYVLVAMSFINNQIINKTDLNNSVRITTPVNSDGNFRMSSSSSFSFTIVKKRLKTLLGLNYSMNNNISIVNGFKQNLKTNVLETSITMKYYSNSWYEGNVKYSYLMNSISSIGSNKVLETNTIIHSGSINLIKSISFSYSLNCILNSNFQNATQSDFFLVHATIDKTFKAPKGLAVRISAFDIFDGYPTTKRYINDNYYEDISVTRLGQFFLFSVIYRFTYYK